MPSTQDSPSFGSSTSQACALFYDPATIFSNPNLVKGRVLVQLAEHYSNTDIATRLSANLTGASVSVAVIMKRLTYALKDLARDPGQTKTHEQLRAELDAIRIQNGGARRRRSAKQASGGLGTRKVLQENGGANGGAGGFVGEDMRGLSAAKMQCGQSDFVRDLRVLEAQWKADVEALQAAVDHMIA